MVDFKRNYMTVSLDLQPNGWNVSVTMTTQEFWHEELTSYPFFYTYMGDRCTWFIHCNQEMTPKLIQTCGEQADRICAENAAINDRRKLANR